MTVYSDGEFLVVPVVHDAESSVYPGTGEYDLYGLLDYTVNVGTGVISICDYDDDDITDVNLVEAEGLNREAMEELYGALTGQITPVRLGTFEGEAYYEIGRQYARFSEQYGAELANDVIGEYL